MNRYGNAILIAACAGFGATAVAACGDDAVGGNTHPVSGTGGGSNGGSGNTTNGGSGNTTNGGSGNTTNGGSGNATAGSDACTGACCPSDNSCYSSSAGKSAPGAICMARIQNTAQHIQLRQTWIDIQTPKGNTIPIVLSTLNQFTQLTEMACNTPNGGTGYMQAVDLDLANGVSTIGYTAFVPNTADAISNGLCYVDIGQGVDTGAAWTDISTIGSETDFDFSLKAADMSPSTDYPPGLPAPMPQPWKVGPTKAKRLTTDFNLTTDRKDLIAKLAPDGDYGKAGFSGVFFYDDATGTSHGYSPVSYQIIYDPKAKPTDTKPSSLIVVPIREAELKYKVNDPKNPNCVGKYLPDNLDPGSGCADPGMTTTKPAWGGIFDTTPGEGDANVTGYFLITELEQVYSKVLGQTLCVSYPTVDVSIADGWATMTEHRCRKSSKWKPSDPVNGLPNGDWCAATNDKATPQCHDAYKSVSFHAFQAFKVKTDHCAPY